MTKDRWDEQRRELASFGERLEALRSKHLSPSSRPFSRTRVRRHNDSRWHFWERFERLRDTRFCPTCSRLIPSAGLIRRELGEEAPCEGCGLVVPPEELRRWPPLQWGAYAVLLSSLPGVLGWFLVTTFPPLRSGDGHTLFLAIWFAVITPFGSVAWIGYLLVRLGVRHWEVAALTGTAIVFYITLWIFGPLLG